MSYKVRKAQKEDAVQVERLYHSLIGVEGCTWNEEYPSKEDISRDINNQWLYVVCNSEGEIVGAAAAGEDEDLQTVDCWSPLIERPCALSRVGITRYLQKQGLARQLLRYIEEDVVIRGYDGLRFLVSQTNPNALRLYTGMEYSGIGKAHMFGIDFYCFEKIL